ncbi:MAG: hypothetical protein MUE68_04175 [Bacteroidetes bacterium]|jgi:hypothetical protein|nr:hypothetical protein [Bacteroidota bacterium]
MRYALALCGGVLLGGASWAPGDSLSGTFEPFDSLMAFLTTQAVLGGRALLWALRSRGGGLTLLVIAGYVGLNLYPYLFGGSESRAWALLGAFTTLSLMVLPIAAGTVGVLARQTRLRSQRQVVS